MPPKAKAKAAAAAPAAADVVPSSLLDRLFPVWTAEHEQVKHEGGAWGMARDGEEPSVGEAM